MKCMYRVFFFVSLIIVQFNIFSRFLDTFAEPDLLLITVVLAGLHKKPETACFAGFFFGLLTDVNTGAVLGSNAFIWIQIAMFNTALRNYLLTDSPGVQSVMAGFSFFTASCLHYIFQRLSVVHEPEYHFFLIAGSRAVVTAIATWPVSKLMLRLGLISDKRDV